MLLFLFKCIVWLLRRIEDFFVFLNDVDMEIADANGHWQNMKQDLETIRTETIRLLENDEGNASFEPGVLEALVKTARKLRTFVTTNGGANCIIKQRDEFDTFFEKVMTLAAKSPDSFDEDFKAIKYTLQIFLNLLNAEDDYEEEKRLIRTWLHKTYCQSVTDLFARGPNGKLASRTFYESCALIYNLHIDCVIQNRQLTCSILENHRTCANNQTGNEYLDFLVGNLMNGNRVWEQFGDLTIEARVELALCLRETQLNREADLVIKLDPVPEVCLRCLISKYLTSKDVIYKVTTTEDLYLEFQEVALILELLAHFSGDERYLPIMQRDSSIIIETGAILINVVRLGRNPGNAFRPLQKLADVTNPAREVRADPVFRFKADLVRVIGNLCWKNPKMQYFAREGEIIPALLECSTIDAKNPFIMQWMIVAIRNICENNIENQAIIEGLSRKGVVRNEILEELGITLPEDFNVTDNIDDDDDDDGDWVTF